MDASLEPAVFAFVQLEYAGVLGPPEGRYVLREHAGEDAREIVVIGRRGGQPAWAGRRERRARRPRPADEPSELELDATRFTVVPAQQLSGEDAGARWLREHKRDHEQPIADALATVNRVLHVHATVTALHGGGQLEAADALVARIGYGVGEQVADGRWSEALEVKPRTPTRHQSRSNALRPQERTAAVLGGRDALLACETLTVRARGDLDAGREREAALQAHMALDAALAELPAWRELYGMERRLEELGELHDGLADAAQAALEGGLAPDVQETVAKTLQRLEAALRARTAATQF